MDDSLWMTSRLTKRDNDLRGPYKLQKLERTLEGDRPTMTFAIETPVGPIAKTWAVSPQKYRDLLQDNRISFSKLACSFFLFADNAGDGFGKQLLGGAHVFAMARGFVEPGTRAVIRQVTPDAEFFKPVENLFGLREGQQHRAIVADVDEVMRRERIAGFGGIHRRRADGPQAENNAGRNGGIIVAMRGGDGERAERQAFESREVVFQKPRQINAEIIQRQVGDGNAAGQVFEVNDGVLKFEQLFAAIFQIVHLVVGLLLDDVFLAGGGNIEQHHAPADALFEIDVFLQLHVGPEIDELDARVGRADAVNAPEALDDADGIPVDVVIDEEIAILKVLPFADAVGGDEQINFALGGELLAAFFGARGERSENAGEVGADGGQRGFVAPGTR